MNQLPKNKQRSSQQNIILIVGILMGIGIVVLATLVFLLFRQRGSQVPMQATPISSSTPAVIALTVVAPTVECNSQTFAIGDTTFQIQALTPGPDGSLTVPTDTAGVAYWQETEGNTLIILSPTPENISLQTTLTPGDTAKVTWEGCNSKTFSLSAPEPIAVNISSLPSQLTSGLTIFFETDPSGNGLIVRGDVNEIIFP